MFFSTASKYAIQTRIVTLSEMLKHYFGGMCHSKNPVFARVRGLVTLWAALFY